MRSVELTWQGGEHTFALSIAHLRALQDKCDAGPAFILQRLSTNQWRVDDVIQPIRLGLEGGGMEKDEARKVVKRHVEDEPITMSVMTAQAVLMSALYGVEDDPVGEPPAGAETDNRSRAESGGSAGSTEPEPS